MVAVADIIQGEGRYLSDDGQAYNMSNKDALKRERSIRYLSPGPLLDASLATSLCHTHTNRE